MKLHTFQTQTIVSIILLVGLAMFGSEAAMAQTDRVETDNAASRIENRQQRIEQRQAEVEIMRVEAEERKTERITQRCEVAGTRIDAHIARYEANKDKHVDFYGRLSENIEKHLARLDGAGCDTSQVKTDLVTLERMASEIGSAHAEFVSLLLSTKNFACNESDGAFKEAVDAALAQLRVVQEQAKSVRSFVRTTLRADLRLLINSCQEASSSTEDADETEE
jgi:hypothetical protein